MNIDDIVNLVSLIGLALPIVINLTKFIGTSTHNNRLTNLANRAEIIVKALDQSSTLTNDQKKLHAVEALQDYAKEVGIKVDTKQLEQYIEASVNSARLQEKKPVNQRLN